jgi:hypothetical protein
MAGWLSIALCGLALLARPAAGQTDGESGLPDAAAAREWIVAAGTNPALRAAVSRALGRLRSRAGLVVMDDGSIPLAETGAGGDTAAVPLDPLFEALRQSDPVLQALAAEVLTEAAEDARVVAALEPLMAVEHPLVRETAVRSLARARRGGPAPTLARERASSLPRERGMPGSRTVGALSRPAAEAVREQGWGTWLFWTVLLVAGLLALLYLVGAMGYYIASSQMPKAMGALAQLVALGWTAAGVMLLRSDPGPGRVAGWLGLAMGLGVAWIARSFFRPQPPLPEKVADDEPLTGR